MESQEDNTDTVQRRKESFAQLCEKLGLQRFAYSLRLHDILETMAEGKILSPSDIKWLNNDRKYMVLAVYSEQLYDRDFWAGHLNEASRWWRDAAQPQQALTRSERSIKSSNRTIQAFGYTTRAAAQLDLDDYRASEESVKIAIGLDSNSPHPWMVLARWHKKKGNLEEAQKLRDHATSLGADYDL